MVFKAFKNTRVNVLVLTPPAVDPEEPPMNIRSITKSRVGNPNAPFRAAVRRRMTMMIRLYLSAAVEIRKLVSAVLLPRRWWN